MYSIVQQCSAIYSLFVISNRIYSSLFYILFTPFILQSIQYTSHPFIYSLHPSPFNIFYTPFTLQSIQYTLHPLKLYSLHPSPFTLFYKPSIFNLFFSINHSTHHSTIYSFYFTLYTLHSTLYTLHSTLYTLHSTLYTLHSKLYTLHYTLYTLHCNTQQSTFCTLLLPLL